MFNFKIGSQACANMMNIFVKPTIVTVVLKVEAKRTSMQIDYPCFNSEGAYLRPKKSPWT